MRTLLVTGGAGYVGTVLVPKLLDVGHKIRVLDLFLYGDENLFATKYRRSGQLELIRGDLRDTKKVAQALKGVDGVIHLAGISNDPSSDLDPELTKEVNITATCKLIDLCIEEKIERFINASSSSVYGIKEELDVTEELSLEPLTVYSESKVAIEVYLAKKKKELVSVSIRSATVCGYSPRLRLDLTVNILTHHALCKDKITVFGGTQKRPNIHIEDITDLYAYLVEAPRHLIDGKCFNACGSNATVNEIAKLVKDTLRKNIAIEKVPTNDLRSYHICAKKLERELGFKPRRSLSDAVSDLKQAFDSNHISNPDDDRYYNVRTMKQVLA